MLGVTQGHWNWYHRKPLVFYSNYGPILYHFRDATRYFLNFYDPPVFSAPIGMTPLEFHKAVLYRENQNDWATEW